MGLVIQKWWGPWGRQSQFFRLQYVGIIAVVSSFVCFECFFQRTNSVQTYKRSVLEDSIRNSDFCFSKDE